MRRTLSAIYQKLSLVWKYRFSLGKKVDWFLSHERLPVIEFTAVRNQLLSDILDHAVHSVPYYQNLLRQGLVAPREDPIQWLAAFPLQTRMIIQTQRDQLVSAAVPKSELFANSTGGSTGTPTQFYQDKRYQQYRKALEYRNLFWGGWNFGDPHLKIWGSYFDLNMQMRLQGRITNWLNNMIIFPASRMYEAKMDEWVEQLYRIRPVVLEGYVNALVTFAKHIRSTNCSPVDAGIKAIITAAETLLPDQRSLLEEVFNSKVFNRYGCREFACIAHECKFGTLHINEDWVYLEVVDGEGNPVPDGETGQIVITNFFNRGMPFIRYAIGDIGALPKEYQPCPCGMPFRYLDSLEGRLLDIIVLPKAGYTSGTQIGNVFGPHDIEKYQVVQDRIDHINILIVPGKNFGTDGEHILKSNLAFFLPGINIDVSYVDQIDVSQSGKYRSVISNVATSEILRSHPGD